MLGVTVADLHHIVHSSFLATFCEHEKREYKNDEYGHEGNYQDYDNDQGDKGDHKSNREDKDGHKRPTVRACASCAVELSISEEEIDYFEDWTRYKAECELSKLQVSTKVHVGKECALPMVVLDFDNVVHDEPGPDVKVPEKTTTLYFVRARHCFISFRQRIWAKRMH